MNNYPAAVFLWIILGTLVSPASTAQDFPDVTPASNPLAPFQRLIGAQWHMGASYQVFEWGIGQLSVRSRGYFLIEGKPKLVSEGIWYWHPADKQIKGVFTAIDMPVSLFDYSTQFEGDKMTSSLLTYDINGTRSDYTETWEFTDESHYEWTLFSMTEEGLKESMSGTFSKQPLREPQS